MLEVETARSVQRYERSFACLDHRRVLKWHVVLVQRQGSRGCLEFPPGDVNVHGAVIVEFNPFSVGPGLTVRTHRIGKDFRKAHGGGRGSGARFGLTRCFPGGRRPCVSRIAASDQRHVLAVVGGVVGGVDHLFGHVAKEEVVVVVPQLGVGGELYDPSSVRINDR